MGELAVFYFVAAIMSVCTAGVVASHVQHRLSSAGAGEITTLVCTVLTAVATTIVIYAVSSALISWGLS